MEQMIIEGGRVLQGEIRISGAKNSTLPILAATLLTIEPLTLGNIPHLRDVTNMLQLLSFLGVSVKPSPSSDCLVLHPRDTGDRLFVPDELMKTMRASVLVIGPLLARFGHCEICLPGGDEIGQRPIDQHLKGLTAMGASFRTHGSRILGEARRGLSGARIHLAIPTVTGTENLLMAATLAKGRTVIENAALEPEVVDLAKCLIAMGARIRGHGSPTIVIDGVDRLHGTSHRILPDRIETGTYLVAAAITGGRIATTATMPGQLECVLDKLQEAGAMMKVGEDFIELDMNGKRPKAVDIRTCPYPDFPTDMQGQFMALNCIAEGDSTVVENIFENRFGHVHELVRMGARITLNGHSTAMIRGVPGLSGTTLTAMDLRASFSLLLAALAATGRSRINHISYIDRGYEFVEEKLGSLGADIHRESV